MSHGEILHKKYIMWITCVFHYYIDAYFVSGGLLSYSMPQGSVRAESLWNFYDNTYDGIWDGQYLSSGLGALTDGRVGPTNLKDDFYKHERGKGAFELKLYVIYYDMILLFPMIYYVPLVKYEHFHLLSAYNALMISIKISWFQTGINAAYTIKAWCSMCNV